MSLYDILANSHPKLARGQVWCTPCGHTTKCDAADAFKNGWPRHCGYTMTIDSPAERKEAKLYQRKG